MTEAPTGHALLDIGGAARLERFGDRVVDRPSPGALGTRLEPARWLGADLRFERDRGWSGPGTAAGPWSIEIDGLGLELRPTEAGQVGLFPEHASMLPWLRDRVRERRDGADSAPPQILHLFAYTGLATLTLADAGAAVTHVDASRPTVTWARQNAVRSGLADRPIRWIVDDALAFAGREVRRGRRYAGLVLDPPTYGHGPGRGDWRIEDDLPVLLATAAQLLEPGGFVLLTAHTPDLGSDRLAGMIRSALRRPAVGVDAGDLFLATSDGRRLGSRFLRAFVRPVMMAGMPSPAPPLITSLANPRVTAAAALRDRRDRERTGLTLIDGARELRRALDTGVEVVEAFVCEPQLAGPDARAAFDGLQALGVDVRPVTEVVIGKIAFGERAEGLVAVVRTPPTDLARLALPADALVVVVEGVEKPGNLGAVLRSADGAGADAVIAATPRTDPYNPNTIRASAGTVFAVPVAAAPTAEVLGWLRAGSFRIVAARVDGATSYLDVDLTGRVAIVLGAEADGLTDTWIGDDVTPVRLPMLGVADSLNVSVSAAILLYESRRQRG